MHETTSQTATPGDGCTLSPEQRSARRRELREGLVGRVLEVRDLSDGLAVRFAATPAVAEELRAFVNFERGCCSFASFELRRDVDEPALWLEIRGPHSAKAQILELFSPSTAD